MSSSVLVLEEDMDLNGLFSLEYNFELLKKIILSLIKSNKDLNNRLRDIELNSNKDLLIDQINNLRTDFDSKFNLLIGRVTKNEGDISNISSIIEGILDKLKLHDDRFNELIKLIEINKTNIAENRSIIDERMYSFKFDSAQKDEIPRKSN